jgi:malate dehydrogenase (oxaloacetate-decarboxylating)
MAYTPGVGTVCMEIKKKPELVDELTLRGRSVAIVTQGNCFKGEKIEPGQMTPVVDWCIAQIRYYACVDSFPFLIRTGANINNVLKDISNSYSVILILDLGLQFDEK